MHTYRPTSLGLAPLGPSPRARDASRSTLMLTGSSTSRSLCLHLFLSRRSRSGLACPKSQVAGPMGHQQQFGNSLDGTRPSALTLEFLRVSQLTCHSAFMLASEVELYSVTHLGMLCMLAASAAVCDIQPLEPRHVLKPKRFAGREDTGREGLPGCLFAAV